MYFQLSCRLAAALLVLFSLIGATPNPPRALAQTAAKPRTITVVETAGLERKGWPITASILVDKKEIDTPDDLNLWRDAGTPQEKRIAVQVLDVVTPEFIEAKDKPEARADLLAIEFCFLADLPANGTVTYQLRTGKPDATAPAAQLPVTPLTVTGEDLGRTVDTGPARFAFDPASGQLLSYTPTLAGMKQPLTFNQGEPRPVHWNPDVWAPPLPWGHTSDWARGKPGREIEHTKIRSGPVALRILRAGIMPTSNGVKTSVTYTAFAGMPFLLESSSMEFTANTHVNAVRNNELVFNRSQHTHGVWINEAGQVNTVLGYDPAEPKKFRGYLGSVDDPMIPFIGLFHNTQRYGIGIVNLARLAYAPLSIASTQDRSHYYFLDYGDHGTGERYEWNFMYVSRSEIPNATIV
ncbi:MAG TPA: hypothetical protein VNA16_09210, partial [Abditibacteriaceae bacterium]|nr:hypothetical protein [Abditibacteriaceae bacterium]